MVKIYTKSGDGGESSLFGGNRVPKNHTRLDAYGTLDELNSVLGWCLVEISDKDVMQVLNSAQSRLFDFGAHLATPPEAQKAAGHLPLLEESWVDGLEQAIDALEAEVPPLEAFVLPGGPEPAARLHLARTVCRRAERGVVAMGNGVSPVILAYLNRLSDFLFMAARAVTLRRGGRETPWKPSNPKS